MDWIQVYAVMPAILIIVMATGAKYRGKPSPAIALFIMSIFIPVFLRVWGIV